MENNISEQMNNNQSKPMGVFWDKEKNNVEFRLYSKNATKVLLCIFKKPKGEDPIMTLDMEKRGNIFQTTVKAYMFDYFKEPMYYGFRVFGANWKYSEKCYFRFTVAKIYALGRSLF